MMKKLPQEVVDSIARYVRELTLMQSKSTFTFKSYAKLSRSWKEAVDSMTFADLYISSNDLDRLQMIVTRKRSSFIRSIDFSVALPGIPDDTDPDSVAVLRNEFIAKASHELLTILSA
jgi:hypothetical protein